MVSVLLWQQSRVRVGFWNRHTRGSAVKETRQRLVRHQIPACSRKEVVIVSPLTRLWALLSWLWIKRHCEPTCQGVSLPFSTMKKYFYVVTTQLTKYQVLIILCFFKTTEKKSQTKQTKKKKLIETSISCSICHTTLEESNVGKRTLARHANFLGMRGTENWETFPMSDYSLFLQTPGVLIILSSLQNFSQSPSYLPLFPSLGRTQAENGRGLVTWWPSHLVLLH